MLACKRSSTHIERDGSQYVDTGIVASHIAQMKLFGIRQGVEFFPSQDNFGNQRKDFIDKVIKYNKLDTRLDSIWDYFLCDGKGLFYIRPTKDNYRLYYFRNHEYRSYYNVDGELEQVVIIYSYKVKTQKAGMYQDIGLGMDGAAQAQYEMRLQVKSVTFVCPSNLMLLKKLTQKVNCHLITST